jgi:DNA-binding CsgD family transcriptional regulator
MARTTRERLIAEVESACRDTSGAVAVERVVAARLQTAVPFDAWCALTIDPASVLPTGGFHENGVPAPRLPQLVEIEARGQDALALPSIARRPRRVSTLSAETRGRLQSSERYREILAPSGLEHELRALFTSKAGVWGALVLFRGRDAPDFSPTEIDLITQATRGVAAALKREMVRAEVAQDDPDGPGLLLLDRSLNRLTATTAADRWLGEIDDGCDPQHGLPYAVMTLANRALTGPAGQPVSSRIRTRTPRWLTLHAERLAGETPHVSIIVEPSRPVEIAQLVADAYQLTTRERHIVRLLASGHTRQEIAQLLTLSPHTVDDHVKKVFAKLQVRNRAELTSRLFFDQHAPRIHNNVPVIGTGWFLR